MFCTRHRLGIWLAGASAALCTAVALLGLPSNALAAGCSESWTNPSGGLWSEASNWSKNSVPTSSDEVCITLGGNYTVTLVGSVAVHSLTLGSGSGSTTQTLDVKGLLSNSTLSLAANSTVSQTGRLILDNPVGGGYADLAAASGAALQNNGILLTQVEGAQPDYLEASVENSASGKIEVKSGELRQDQATTTTNDGMVTVVATAQLNMTSGSGKFVNNGTVADNGSVSLTSGLWTQSGGGETGNAVVLHSGSLVDSVGGGQFALLGNTSLSGTVPVGQTVTVTGVPGVNSTATLTGASVTNDGTLILDSQAGGGYANINGSPLVNKATMQTQVEGTQPDYFETNVDNAATGKIEVKSGELHQDLGTTTTNEGTVTIDAAGTFNLTSGSGTFVNEGTVADNGSVSLTSGLWTQSGGGETGNAVVLHSGSLVDSVGGGQFALLGSTSLSGTIPAGQTVTVTGVPGVNSTATLTGASVTNDGTLILDSQAGGGYANINGSPFVNKAILQTQVEGASPDYIETNVDNAATGTIEVKSGELHQDQGTTTTNDAGGTITVDAASVFNLSSGSGKFVNEGTVADNGSVSLTSGSWAQSGGGETGSAVALHSGSLIDSVGGGQFALIGSTSLSGTIPAGQTVTVTGVPGINSAATLTGGSVTNDGTLLLDSQLKGGYADLIAASGSVLQNDGVLQAQVEGASPDYLETNVDNAATGTIEVKSGELHQDLGTATTNEGTVTIDAAGTFNLTSGSGTFVNEGTVADSGLLSLTSGSWTQSGGGETGNAVVLHSGSLIDSVGGGQFALIGNTSLSGAIPVGQTVTVTGVPGVNSTATLTGASVTNDGTLILDSQASGGYANINGSPFVNKAILQTQVEGASPDYLETNVDNAATGTIEVKSGELHQDQGTATTNEGTVTIDAVGKYNLTSGSGAFTNQTTGTLKFGIASSTSFGTINFSGAMLHLLGGIADPILASSYNPAVGTEYDVITGADPGKFTSVLNNFNGDYTHPTFIGLVRARDNTATSLASSANPSTYGQTVTYTATVTPGPNLLPSLTGTVTYFEGSSVLGTSSVSTSGGVTTATFTTSGTYSVGSHSITASYGGDGNYQPSPVSAPLTQVVNAAPTKATGEGPVGGSGTVSGGVAGSGVLAFASAAPSPPKLAVSGNLAPVSGKVLVRLSGTSKFVILSFLEQIPFGTVVDATNGTVSITTAAPGGGTQTGQFSGGMFVLTQGRNGLVVAKLTGGDFSVCPHPVRAASSVLAHASSGHASGKHVVRKLWANAHGHFSTQGNYAAGAVQGTEWLTEDLCEGTFIKVTRDRVKVTDLVHHRHIEVLTGHSYLAKPRH